MGEGGGRGEAGKGGWERRKRPDQAASSTCSLQPCHCSLLLYTCAVFELLCVLMLCSGSEKQDWLNAGMLTGKTGKTKDNRGE